MVDIKNFKQIEVDVNEPELIIALKGIIEMGGSEGLIIDTPIDYDKENNDVIITNFNDMVSNYLVLYMWSLAKEKYEITGLLKQAIELEILNTKKYIHNIVTKNIDEEDYKMDLLDEVFITEREVNITIKKYLETLF